MSVDLLTIHNDNNPQNVFDRHFIITCPHCGTTASLSAISLPRFELLRRFDLKRVGIVYRCDACNDPVFLRFRVVDHPSTGVTRLSADYEEIERPVENFELQYLPGEVADDFREALTCYSHGALNGFAAMCRRCIQSVAMELGAEGSTKVQAQLTELKEMGVLEEEGFEQLKAIMLSGHDGAHPHLPKLTPARAAVLLELMKDTLYQLFVRKAKIQEAMELRRKQFSSPDA